MPTSFISFILTRQSLGLVSKTVPTMSAGEGGVSVSWLPPVGGAWVGAAQCSHGDLFWPLTSPTTAPLRISSSTLGQVDTKHGASNRTHTERKLPRVGGISRSLAQNSSREQLTHCCLLSPPVRTSRAGGHLLLLPLDAFSDGTGRVRMTVSLT